ncbi:MAG: antiterminator LoaP [Muribaculaceae bacterium]|nr:antiterminator LoaP [Roseburia sp.]MCM1432117.1 antiterminator LoaP [Muribaculaceae bacterium]MCM1493984.1 antiterminator LoaP [Muribaculaceae bacterium]
MWYVIQVLTGEEERTADKCRKLIGSRDSDEGVLQDCFIPYTKRQRRYEGQWHIEKRVLFPGYVFLTSDSPEELFLRLKKVPGLTKLLGTGQDIVPLTAEEEALLRRLGGDEQIVETSIGVIENDQIIITEGPLQGMEGCIRRIDRHKRMAWLEVEMMGRRLEVKVGLEVVEKNRGQENV